MRDLFIKVGITMIPRIRSLVLLGLCFVLFSAPGCGSTSRTNDGSTTDSNEPDTVQLSDGVDAGSDSGADGSTGDTLKPPDGDPSDGAAPTVTLLVESGDGQTAVVGEAVASVPTVKVTDSNGTPLAGIVVRFEVVAGDGSLEGSEAVTNKDGLAWVAKWTLGAKVGTNRLRASVGASQVEFSASATPGPAAAISYSGGNTPVNATVDSETELVFQVSDANGNPVEDGVEVQFSITNGLGNLVTGSAKTVGGSVSATLRNGISIGQSVVSAAVGGVSASVTVARQAGKVATILIETVKVMTVGGSDTALIRLFDTFDNPVQSASLTAELQGYSQSKTQLTYSGAGISWTFDAPTKAGVLLVVVTDSEGAVGKASIVLLPGPITQIVSLYGDGATLVKNVSTTFWLAAYDEFGNPGVGALTISANSALATVTELSGSVTLGSFVGEGKGAFSFKLTAVDNGVDPKKPFKLLTVTSADGKTSKDFTVTVSDTPGSGLSIESPADQATVVVGGQVSIVAALSFADGPITFSLVGGTGTFSNSQTTITVQSSNNKATATLIAGPRAGEPIIVHVSSGANAPRVLTLNPVGGDVATISAGEVTGGVVGGQLGRIHVQLKDPYGNPISGDVEIEWTIESGSGTFGATGTQTTTTSSNATSFVDVTINSVGTTVVKATVKGTAISTSASVVGEEKVDEPNRPATIVLNRPRYDWAPPGAPIPLVATVTDNDGQPLPGIEVTFSKAGLGTFEGATTLTSDAAGKVSVTFRAGSEVGVETELAAWVIGSAGKVLQATITLKTHQLKVISGAGFVDLYSGNLVGGFLPNSKQYYAVFQLSYGDAALTVSHALLIDAADHTVTQLASILGVVTAIRPSSAGTHLIATGKDVGLGILDLAQKRWYRLDLAPKAWHLLADGSNRLLVESLVTELVPRTLDVGTSFPVRVEVVTRDETHTLLLVDFRVAGAPKQQPIDEYYTFTQASLNLPLNAWYVRTIACGDDVYLLDREGTLSRWRTGELEELTVDVKRLERSQGLSAACIAAFLKGTELEAIEFDSQDAFTPSPLQTFGADPLTLWIDHDRDGVLSALPSGPLTWSDANGVISLSDKPLSGDLSGLQLTADRSLLVFLGRLDGDHPGLYLTDYATPGKDSTRRLSPNIAGCSNGCDAKLVQLFSDGEGVVFVQGIDPQQSISRAFRIRFADLPADGPPGDALVPLGFGGVGSTAYTQPGQSVQTLSLGGDRFIGLYGNPLSPGDYQIDVVDRTSNESFTFISYGLASVLETESFRPRWSDDGSYMGVPLSDSTDAVRIFDVDAMISGLKNGAP